MQPGPELIFECPNCNKQYARGSIISGNTFGGTFYSDGRFFAMMLPQFPQLIRCEACKTAFWLNEETMVDQIEWNDPFFERREKITNAEFLGLEDYLDLLSKHFYQNTVEEIFLRTELWRCYNDRTRAQKKRWNTKKEQLQWQENIAKLILMLQHEVETDNFMLAELHRHIGKFEEAETLLTSSKDQMKPETIAKIRALCRKKSTEIIEL